MKIALEFGERQHRIRHFALLPDGKSVLMLMGNGSIQTWDVESGRAILVDEHKQGTLQGSFREISIPPDGHHLVAAKQDDLEVYRLHDFEHVRTCSDHQGEVRSIVFTHDGAMLVSGDVTGTIKAWDLRQLETNPGVVLRHLDTEDVTAISEGKRLVFRTYRGVTLVHSFESPDTRVTIEHSRMNPVSAFAGDGRSYIIADRSDKEQSLIVYDLETGQEISSRQIDSEVNSITQIPESTRVAVGTEDGITIWDHATQKYIAIAPREYGISSITASPGARAKTPSAAGVVRTLRPPAPPAPPSRH
ncbi:MAG: hypothetical protein IH961_00380 [Chloroflexi bacterium]|nr:hypothetical protein [Chloroflexota bacterium]